MASHILPEDEPLEKNLFWIGLLSVAFMWLLVVYYWPSLPDMIPSHFNVRGEVDDYASKYIILLLPVIGGATWGLIAFFGNKPNLYNYPVKITAQNKEVQYKLARRLLTLMNASTAIMFLYIQWTIIQAALESKIGISIYIVFLLGGWILFITLVYFYLAKRNE
jgi:uncharacterized membrane protein